MSEESDVISLFVVLTWAPKNPTEFILVEEELEIGAVGP